MDMVFFPKTYCKVSYRTCVTYFSRLSTTIKRKKETDKQCWHLNIESSVSEPVFHEHISFSEVRYVRPP